ncbi:iron uptake transporter deferrochelatase/peroxidase subunit [Cellulomonas sp. P22]|uniref:iron uptake transporter deferrochelatase/peroxidase subunit n=1 Tax=Cellulomonas sp. P22 TaxID=3373189 RepID=UPI0037B0B973
MPDAVDPATTGTGAPSPAPSEHAPSERAPSRRALSRRALLGLGGAAALGAAAAAGAGAGRATAPATASPGTGASAGTYAFTGAHQAGIVTPAQDRMHIAAFDLTTTSRDELVALLRTWTVMAARLTQGLDAGPYGPASGPYDAPPDDTGEAFGLPPAGLTITFGFGRSLFVGTPAPDGTPGVDRFGLADRLPAALVELPHFPQDVLEDARCGGDLVVQACADDPQVAVHAIRNLSRAAFGTATIRWSQLGYGRTSSTSTAQTTPRNLFGFKDGTANVKAEEPDALAEHVWVQPQDAPDEATAWMTGGSYLVARRIRMTIETWDRTSLREQEAVIGRTKGEGAPLSGGSEHTEPDLALVGRGDAPLVPLDSHVRLAHPTSHGGARMLRRGYNFTDGNDTLGRLDAGLFFVAFVRDPRTQYIPMQTVLARDDALSEYQRHTGSGLFAVPPGVPDGTLTADGTSPTGEDVPYVGQTLLA